MRFLDGHRRSRPLFGFGLDLRGGRQAAVVVPEDWAARVARRRTGMPNVGFSTLQKALLQISSL